MPVSKLHSQVISLMGHSLRGFDDEAPVIGQALKALSALDDRHSQVRFQLLDGRGKGRLGHMTRRRCAREVALFGQGHQIFEFPAEHRVFATTLLYARRLLSQNRFAKWLLSL